MSAGLWRVAAVAAVATVLAMITPPAALAVIDDNVEPEDRAESCKVSSFKFELGGDLVPVGLPLSGSAMRIEARSAKLVGRREGSGAGSVTCSPAYFPIPSFEWKIAAAPPGQVASIADGKTLAPIVNLGGPGSYRIRLVACPNKCTLQSGGSSKRVGPLSRDLVIDAVDEMSVPPETQPTLPAIPGASHKRYSYNERKARCPGFGGATHSQWTAVEPVQSPADYKLVEGEVEGSKVARKDNPLNHESQDHIWFVRPDPSSYGLPQPSITGEMEMEKETDYLPTQALSSGLSGLGGSSVRSYLAPSPGDRASTWGYWIFDCGHDPFRTEIHPPVGIGVHRPRPVQIPESFSPPGFPNGLGSNLLVPGVVTDLYFSRTSGEITSNCSQSGLSQAPAAGGACILEPHEFGKVTFNVYLPRSPLFRAREAGLNPPPVPLFVAAEQVVPGIRAEGPDPVVVERQNATGDVTWLEVTVDLTELPLANRTWARRISAAWAYPHPENWGARSWNVRLDKLHVGDDSEIGGDDGDWRFFFHTNNRDQEWTRVFSCWGCIDDDDTKPLGVETGPFLAKLGPAPVLFPGQKITVQTGGFDDEVDGDDIGLVLKRHPQEARKYVTASQGSEGSYKLEYTVSPGLAVPVPSLEPEAQSLLAAYTARSQPRGFPVAPSTSDISPDWDPASVVLGKRVLRNDHFELFEDEREERAMTGISPAALKRGFAQLRRSDPKRLSAILAEIRAELAALPSPLRGDYGELVATLRKALPRSLLRRALPPGFANLRSARILARPLRER